MLALTPSERRGATVVLLLLAIGAGYDLWRARHPALTRAPVPWPEPVAGPATGTSGASPQRTAAGDTLGGGGRVNRVDLNRASIAELDALPGIGPVLAQRIVAYRGEHGPFHSLDELLAVRGIGPRLLERLRTRVRTGPPAGGRDSP